MIDEFMKSPVGRIVLSVIWGLGLATLFRKACEGKSCSVMQYVSPNPNEIKNTYYNYGTNDCYQYDAVITSCGDTRSSNHHA